MENLRTTRAIVLHTLKYGDNGLITTLYTENFGRMSFILQGIRSKKSNVKAMLLKQLYLLDLVVDYKPGRNLQRIREMKVNTPFISIPFAFKKSTQAIFLAEFLDHVLKEEEPNLELFRFLFDSIRLLDLEDQGAVNFSLVFICQLARYLGFAPLRNFSADNKWFDLMAGTFKPTSKDQIFMLDEIQSTLLSELLSITFQTSGDYRPSGRSRSTLLDIMIMYYGLHLGGTLNLKSIEILREIFV